MAAVPKTSWPEPNSTPGLHNLVAHCWFTPLGWGAVLAAVVPCVAFYTGAEIVTIAAAESNEPLKMWPFPRLSYATIGLMVIVIDAMALLPSTRSQFLMGGLTLLFILVSYQIRKVLRSRRTAVPGPAAEKPELAPVPPTR